MHVYVHESLSLSRPTYIAHIGIIRSDNGCLLARHPVIIWYTDKKFPQTGIYVHYEDNFDGLVQDCSNSSALAMELVQSCTEPSIWSLQY